MRIDADWLRKPGVQTAMRLLSNGGHKAYFVGGCVRNALLSAGATDIDVSTDATPDRVIDLANTVGVKAVPTGIDHGTVTLVIDALPVEVTTFRRDVETDGRRAVVAFSDNIEDDARRRDFTMNALYADATGKVLDPLNGLQDLLDRHVRFIDDPKQRIREDYLRILRFFRFTALYGDPNLGLDGDGLAACAELLDGIDGLSKERVGHEMRKLLSAENPAQSVAAMMQSGVLSKVLPGADAKALPLLVDLEGRHSTPINWLARLACLGGQNPQENLRLSKQDTKDLQAILKVIENGLRPSVAAYNYTVQIAQSAALVLGALTEQPLPKNLKLQIQKGADAIFPIKAADLPDELSGKQLGAALRQLEARWIASDFSLSKADLLR